MEYNEKQIRKLREQADKARQTGNNRKALELCHELCKAEPGEPRWPQLCGELHRKLGQLDESLEHFVAAARIYHDQGFDVKAVAMCKVLLGLDPLNALGLNLLEEITATPRLGAEAATPQSFSRLPAVTPAQTGPGPAPLADGAQGRLPPATRDSGRPAQPAGVRSTSSPPSAYAPPSIAPEDSEDPFAPSPAPSQRGLPLRGPQPAFTAQPASPPPRDAVHPAPVPSTISSGPAAPRRPARETSPRELQALNLSELEALLQPTAPVGSPGSAAPAGRPSPPREVEPPVARAEHAAVATPRATLDLAIEIEGFDTVLGASPPASQAPTAAPPVAVTTKPAQRRVQETLTISEDELEILEAGAFTLEEDDAVVVLEPAPPQAPAPGIAAPLAPLPVAATPQAPLPRAPQALSEAELEILDDSDIAFMEALEKSTTGEQLQPKKRPTLTLNAPLESLELRDVMPRLERLPSQPHMDELYEIELGEPEPAPSSNRPVESADYERRLTPAKPPPDMTPPGLFRALGIDATKSLVTRMSFVEKKAGEVVIQQGDVGGSLYVIVRGEVRIVKELGAERVEVSRLGEGEFFGEMALVTDTPRVATVEAVTELDLLEVSRETLRLLIQDFPQVVPNLIKFLKDRLLEVFVKTSEFLRPVPEKVRWQLARKFKLYEIHEGKTILREGKPSGGMFIFLAGHASVTRQRRGRTLDLAELGPGALIGEISLLTGGPAVATVTARTKCWLLAVSQKQFEVLCQNFPQMRSFVEDVAEQRRRENAQLLSDEQSFVSQELRLV